MPAAVTERTQEDMRIVFAGTPDTAVPTLRALLAEGHEIVCAVTREDAPQGRKKTLTPSAVAEFAAAHGIRTIKANRLTANVTEQVALLKPELGVVVAYGGLIGRELLETPQLGWINLHFSELPRWRGAAPVQRALMAGERELGMSVFRLVEKLDAGDIVASASHTAEPYQSAGEVLQLMAESGASLVLQAVSILRRNNSAGVPQQETVVSYAHKLTRESGRLDPRSSLDAFVSAWAGVTPEPGAYLELGDKTLKIHEIAQLTDADVCADLATGQVDAGVLMLLGGLAILQLADGAVELVTVQPAGKPRMAAAAWLNGRGKRVEFNN